MAEKEDWDVRSILESFHDIWEPLTEEQRNLLVESAQVVRFSRNASIFSEGEKPVMMICLAKGKVKVFKDGIGHFQIMRMISEGNIFSYRAYFTHENYKTSAVAFEDSVVCMIPMKLIERLVAENGRLGMVFIRMLSEHLGTADRRTISLTQKHIRGRLAESLLVLEEKYSNEADGSTLNVYLSREELAQMSNMTTSNAIRTLSSFAEDKIVALDGKKIKILDKKALQHISDEG